MKSELSFLMDLFLNEEVPSPIKKLVASRIKEVEKNLSESIVPRGTYQGPTVGALQPPLITLTPHVVSQQSPSMQRLMEKHPDLVPIAPPPVVPPAPVTPAAAQALAERQKLISRAIVTDKPEPGRTSPRKF